MVAITTVHLFGLAAVLVVFVLPALLVYRIAERKGRPGWLYLIACLVIGWPIPLLAAAIVRPRRDVPS